MNSGPQITRELIDKLIATMELIRVEQFPDLEPVTVLNYLEMQETITERLGMTVDTNPANPSVTTSARFRRVFDDAANRTGLAGFHEPTSKPKGFK
jgi:hypothetical protein|tara:strand:+ start:160 stop:447 length:288 start_codon:yes stop_codon:yes gene_type:complete